MVESPPRLPDSPGLFEFFAGGGMVRAGLGEGWTCRFANDFDPAKAAAYRANWGDGALNVGDIAALKADDLPGTADLMWGSFPCQDLSLAGAGAGLAGARSGAFHAFRALVSELAVQGRAPRIVAIENVCGALTSREGRDFETMCRAWSDLDYVFGSLVINADLFLPQSRPRLFVIAVRSDVDLDPTLILPGPRDPFHPASLRRAADRLPPDVAQSMVWWRLPGPAAEPPRLAELAEPDANIVRWHSETQTAQLLAMMSPANRAKIDAARRAEGRQVGALFRRTRTGPDGIRAQRAEVRFDRAGCLRTPGGGSSRQTLVVVEAGRVRTRLMTARETARLMGLPDDYRLPASYGAACHLTGDGVAVPVVRHLARCLFEPLLRGPAAALRAA